MSAASALRDIADRDDVAALVAEFCRRAFADEVLGPTFVDVARVDLSVHLPVMGEVWETVLLRAGLYRGSARPPHVALATNVELTDAHFARWLDLWTGTVEDRHAGTRADLATTQATRIAGSIRRRPHGGHSELVTIEPRRPEERRP